MGTVCQIRWILIRPIPARNETLFCNTYIFNLPTDAISSHAAFSGFFFVAEITRAGTNGDGVPDNVDNCISVANPGEEYFAATASS